MPTEHNDKASILSSINSPEDVRRLSVEQLPQLCADIRDFLISTLSRNPGHFASSMGSVELTVALHYVFNPTTASYGMWAIRLIRTSFSPDAAKRSPPATGAWAASAASPILPKANTTHSAPATPPTASRQPSAWPWPAACRTTLRDAT